MKLLYIIGIVLLMVPLVHAQLEIKSIKAYIDDQRDTSVDEDGGTMDAKPDSILELTVQVDNKENKTTKVRYTAVLESIDDGDDIEKKQNWFDVPADDDKAKVLSFSIPTDAREDDYVLELLVEYEFDNGTDGDYTVEFEVRVREEKVGEEKDINLAESFNNLTLLCGNIISNIDGAFGYIEKYSTCSDELSTVKEERGKLDSDYTNCNQNLDVCRSEKQDIDNEKNNLQNQISGMITRTDAEQEKTVAVDKAKSEKDQIIFGVGILGVVVFVWQTKRKRGMTVADSVYYEKK